MAQTMRVATENTRPMPKKIAFNINNLTSAKCPADKDRIYLWDSNTPGLAMMITGTGHKSFYFVKKIHGAPKRLKLGTFPDVAIQQARNLVKQHAGEVAKGNDPFAAKRTISKSATLGELWDRWKTEHATERLRDRTIITDESRFDTCFADWKGRRIASIRESDVRSKHVQLGKDRGHTTANRAIQLLRRLFYFARVEPNPAAQKCVDLFREKKRDRFIQPEEMPQFIAALNLEANQTMQDLFFMLLWTAARRENVQAMAWADISFDAATWKISGDEAKGHDAITVPLTDRAMEILKSRRSEATEGGEFVFASYGKRGHVVELKGAWSALLKRAGIKDLHPHDLRRTTASYMAMNGVTESVIAKALGHRTVSVTGIYARLTIEPVRNAFEISTRAILAAGASPYMSVPSGMAAWTSAAK